MLDQIEEGDKVVTRVFWSGTHTGNLLGIPPTGKSFQAEGVITDRIVNGQIQERWEIGDLMTMMQQLGVVLALT